jgi:4'-phosphopantetheinyl transferase
MDVMRPVWPWPGPLPVPVDGFFAICVTTLPDQSRETVRLQTRRAIREVLARLLDMPAESIRVTAEPGCPPRVVLAHASAYKAHSIECSISHETGLSLVALNLHGRGVGVDVMRVQDIGDWEVVARDYLGSAVAGQLAKADAASRAQLFAEAWTTREASLTSLGLPLAEWTPRGLPCRLFKLELPTDLAGSLAIAY